MNQIILFSVLLILITINGCSTNQNVIQKPNYSTIYSKIYYEDLSYGDIHLNNFNDDEVKEFNDSKESISNAFRDILFLNIKSDAPNINILEKNSGIDKQTLILACSMTEYDLGIWVLRRTVGFGAGKVKMEIRCNLMDENRKILRTGVQEDSKNGGSIFSAFKKQEYYSSELLSEVAKHSAEIVDHFLSDDIPDAPSQKPEGYISSGSI